MKYQIAEVSFPLNSVSDICDARNRVMFGSAGGLIYNVSSGKELYFAREDGIHVLICWAKPNGENSSMSFLGPEA